MIELVPGLGAGERLRRQLQMSQPALIGKPAEDASYRRGPVDDMQKGLEHWFLKLA